jgi:sugar lactone lactonase YvrE
VRAGCLVFFCALRLAAQCACTTLAGHAITFAGDGVPVSQAVFHKTGGIAAGSDGSLYIADTGNNRIRRLNKSGVIRTVAGTGQPSFGGDNSPATAAALSGPTGMALGPGGTLYFSDTQNNRVRAVKPDGTIVTVAGNGAWKFGGDNGPATAASLNKPGALSFDASGNLLIADIGRPPRAHSFPTGQRFGRYSRTGRSSRSTVPITRDFTANPDTIPSQGPRT